MYTPSNFVVKDDPSVPLTFDFSKDYPQAVLMHEQCGGGTFSFGLLEKLRISSKIRHEILDRISSFGCKYYAVHVRNTDLKTDYRNLFSRIASEVRSKRLLVCSDDSAVIEYARSFFSSSEILTSSKIPDNGGKPLHYFGDHSKNAIDSIVDLLALGKSEKLFIALVSGGLPSGFSRLANYLFDNKYLIDDLLGLPRVHPVPIKSRLNQCRRRAKEYLRSAYFNARRFKLGSTADRSR